MVVIVAVGVFFDNADTESVLTDARYIVSTGLQITDHVLTIVFVAFYFRSGAQAPVTAGKEPPV